MREDEDALPSGPPELRDCRLLSSLSSSFRPSF